jgi:hypothetical protein
MIPASLPYEYLHHFDRHDRTPRLPRPIARLSAPRNRSARAMQRSLGRAANLRRRFA